MSTGRDIFETKWAVNDLEDFTNVGWEPGKTTISADTLDRVREASAVIIKVFRREVFVPKQPIVDALQASEEDGSGYLARIEQLRAKLEEERADKERVRAERQEEIDGLRREVRVLRSHKVLLEGCLETAIEELGEYKEYGGGQTFSELTDDMTNVLGKTDIDKEALEIIVPEVL